MQNLESGLELHSIADTRTLCCLGCLDPVPDSSTVVCSVLLVNVFIPLPACLP